MYSNPTPKVTRLVVMAVLSTLFVIVIYLIAVRTHLGQRVDGVAFNRRSVVSEATTRRTDRLLGTVSVASLFVLGSAIVLLALARRRVLLAVAVGVAMSAAVLTTEILKLQVLTRPNFSDVAGVLTNSYPSGHATIAMVLSLGIVMVAPLSMRRLAVVVAALVSAAFGTAVLASGWHRPSDVIGAYFVALAWFSATSALVVTSERRIELMRGQRSATPVSRPFLVAAVAAVFSLLMFMLWKSVAVTGLRTVIYAAPYVVASIGIDLAGIAVVGTYYVVQRTS